MDLLIEELRTLAKECRLYAKCKSPEAGLGRVARTIESLLQSFDDEAISIENPLTKREAEIIELISLGYTNKELAVGLSISEKTVEYHITSILKKTQASKRTEAVTNAIKFKWLHLS